MPEHIDDDRLRSIDDRRSRSSLRLGAVELDRIGEEEMVGATMASSRRCRFAPAAAPCPTYATRTS